MNENELLNKIKNAAKLKDKKAFEEQEKYENDKQNCIDKIIEMLPRIIKTSHIVKTLKEHNFLKRYEYEIGSISKLSKDNIDNYFADRYHHQLGFVYANPNDLKTDYNLFNDGDNKEMAFAVLGGGCCNFDVIVFQNGYVYTKGDKKEVLRELKGIIDGFDNYEKKVVDFVNSLDID
jgi:hypothetical protein